MPMTKSIFLTESEIERAKNEWCVKVCRTGETEDNGKLIEVSLESPRFINLFGFLRSIIDFRDYTDEQIEEYYIRA